MVSAPDSEVPELLEWFPDPVVRYEPSADGRIVCWANPEAQELFGSRADVGRPLGDVLDLVEGAPAEWPEVDPEGRFTIITGGDERERTVLLRWVGADGGTPDEGGYLVLTDLTDHVGDREYGGEERAETGGEGKTAGHEDPAGNPASPTMEEIFSVLSHDLRNPLEVAEIRLEAARETGDDVHFEKAELALDRIEGLIRDVRTVVRAAPSSTRPRRSRWTSSHATPGRRSRPTTPPWRWTRRHGSRPTRRGSDRCWRTPSGTASNTPDRT